MSPLQIKDEIIKTDKTLYQRIVRLIPYAASRSRRKGNKVPVQNAISNTFGTNTNRKQPPTYV